MILREPALTIYKDRKADDDMTKWEIPVKIVDADTLDKIDDPRERELLEEHNEILITREKILTALEKEGYSFATACYTDSEAEERMKNAPMNSEYRRQTIERMKEWQAQGSFDGCIEEKIDFDAVAEKGEKNGVSQFDLEWYYINFVSFYVAERPETDKTSDEQYDKENARIIIKMLNDEVICTMYYEYHTQLMEAFKSLSQSEYVDMEQLKRGIV